MSYDPNDVNAGLCALFSQLGAALSLGLCAIGSAYGTASIGIGISSLANTNIELSGDEETKLLDKARNKPFEYKNFLPIIIAGVIAIYGLILAVIINANQEYSLVKGFKLLGAGLSMGLAGLGSGIAIGKIGQAFVTSNAKNPKLFGPMMISIIFAEAIGLYGLIVGLIAVSSS